METLDLETVLTTMASELKQQLSRRGIPDPLMVGIHTGGVWVAERLHEMLKLSHELGVLDISFYRDDFTRVGFNPRVKTSKLPFTVDDRHILLVDDVLYTGRTIRAAMNELFDYGRPAGIILATLVDRGGREIPIAADVVGCKLQLSTEQHIKLTGPEPLQLKIIDGDS